MKFNLVDGRYVWLSCKWQPVKSIKLYIHLYILQQNLKLLMCKMSDLETVAIIKICLNKDQSRFRLNNSEDMSKKDILMCYMRTIWCQNNFWSPWSEDLMRALEKKYFRKFKTLENVVGWKMMRKHPVNQRGKRIKFLCHTVQNIQEETRVQLWSDGDVTGFEICLDSVPTSHWRTQTPKT